MAARGHRPARAPGGARAAAQSIAGGRNRDCRSSPRQHTSGVGLASGAEKRTDKRVPTRLPATLWGENKRQSLACTIRDRSSGGAKLEFGQDRYSDGLTELKVGDKLSLTFNTSAHERTSVGCMVMWIAGSRCGVRFLGQFHTQLSDAKKTSKVGATSEKGATLKTKLSSVAWRRTSSQSD